MHTFICCALIQVFYTHTHTHTHGNGRQRSGDPPLHMTCMHPPPHIYTQFETAEMADNARRILSGCPLWGRNIIISSRFRGWV